MSSVKKEPPRFHIGDWVKFDYGPKKVSAMIVEDRGLLGIQGRRLYRVQLDKELGEASTFEVPENELETELPPVRLSYEVKYISTGNTNVWHASTRKERVLKGVKAADLFRSARVFRPRHSAFRSARVFRPRRSAVSFGEGLPTPPFGRPWVSR